MNSRVFLIGVTLAVLCACLAQQAEAGWRDRFDVAGLTRNNPSAQRLLDGPLGPIIDIVVEIILFVLDFALGGAYAPINKFKKLESEVKMMHSMMQGGLPGANPSLSNMLI